MSRAAASRRSFRSIDVPEVKAGVDADAQRLLDCCAASRAAIVPRFTGCGDVDVKLTSLSLTNDRGVSTPVLSALSRLLRTAAGEPSFSSATAARASLCVPRSG
jgi:hypothetical protein